MTDVFCGFTGAVATLPANEPIQLYLCVKTHSAGDFEWACFIVCKLCLSKYS